MSDLILVNENVSVVKTDNVSLLVSESETVSVISKGIQGPPGASVAGFVYTQVSAAIEWVVNHNLGFYPSVVVTNTGGQQAIADVAHFSVNQARIYFQTATAGQARCV